MASVRRKWEMGKKSCDIIFRGLNILVPSTSSAVDIAFACALAFATVYRYDSFIDLPYFHRDGYRMQCFHAKRCAELIKALHIHFSLLQKCHSKLSMWSPCHHPRGCYSFGRHKWLTHMERFPWVLCNWCSHSCIYEMLSFPSIHFHVRWQGSNNSKDGSEAKCGKQNRHTLFSRESHKRSDSRLQKWHYYEGDHSICVRHVTPAKRLTKPCRWWHRPHMGCFPLPGRH